MYDCINASLSACLYVCMRVCLSVCSPCRPPSFMAVCKSLCMSVHLSGCPSVCTHEWTLVGYFEFSKLSGVCTSVHLSGWLTGYMFVYLCIWRSDMFVPPSVCICACVSICLSVRPSLTYTHIEAFRQAD